MFIFSAVFFSLIAVMILYVIMIIYASLVTLKHNTAKPWFTIDVLLKQQHCISGLEEAKAGKSAFYRQSANDNNIRIEQFRDLSLPIYLISSPLIYLSLFKNKNKALI